MSSDDPTQSLIQSRSDLEVSCTAVDDSIELTLFRNRKAKTIAKQIIRLNALECEQAEPGTNNQQHLSCCDHLKHRQILSPRLYKIRDKGNELIRSIVLPTLSRWNSKLNMILVASLILGLVSLVFAVANAIHNPHNIFTPVRITMTVIKTALSLMHLLISYLHNRKSNYCCIEKIGNSKLCLKLCSPAMWELYCILLKEAFEYPVLVCNIIENATAKGFQTWRERLQLCYFIYSIVNFVYEVYFTRCLVLCYSIRSLHQLRQGNKVAPRSDHEINRDMVTDIETTQAFTGHGLKLEIIFFLHVIFQMLSQILMLSTLWVKIKCINQFLQDQGVIINIYCWMLIIGGFILPILGTLAFYLPWNKQIQIYPIEFMISLFYSLQKCGITSISQNARKNLKRINDSIITAMKQEKKPPPYVIYTVVTTPKLTILGILFFIPLLTTLVGIWNGPTVEIHNNKTLFICDITMATKNITDGNEVSNALWSFINFAAFNFAILSNALTIAISSITVFIVIVLLPVLPIFVIVLYCVLKCMSPHHKDYTLFSILCDSIAIVLNKHK